MDFSWHSTQLHNIIQIDTNQRVLPIQSELRVFARFTKLTWTAVRDFKLTLNHKPRGCDGREPEWIATTPIRWLILWTGRNYGVRRDDEWKKFLTKIGQFGLSNFSKLCPHRAPIRARSNHPPPPPPKANHRLIRFNWIQTMKGHEKCPQR